jgi:hypothetical protein
MGELIFVGRKFKTHSRWTFDCPCGDRGVITVSGHSEPTELGALIRQLHATCPAPTAPQEES